MRRAQVIVQRDDGTIHNVDLDEEQMEWILNSLRLMQEQQQQNATENTGKTLTKQDIVDALNIGGDIGKGRNWKTPDPDAVVDLNEFFLEQFHDVTALRESLVQAVGGDLTDGDNYEVQIP